MADDWVVEHERGWLQVRVPLPYSLKWVNAYLLPDVDSSDWTLIDPGLHTDAAEDVWRTVLSARGIAWDRIARIVLTHHHPDHYGLAGWFQARTGAPIWMSETAWRMVHRMWGDENITADLLQAFRMHGLPASLAEGMKEHLLGFFERVSPQPTEVVRLRPGDNFQMAGISWAVIGGEGHAPGHLSFYDADSGRLICGDQVLPDISPNIGWLPSGDPDPLGSFLASLQNMRRLDVSCAYPGHRNPFKSFRERVAELIDHHDRRLDQLAELIGTGRNTSFEICERLFGERLRGNLHNLRFALSETIAHLVLLENRGILRRTQALTWTREI